MYALIFIGVMIAVGLAVDRHTSRLRRSVARPAALRLSARPATYARTQRRPERTAPGTTTQPGWQHGGLHDHG
jgi:hypothetical protein